MGERGPAPKLKVVKEREGNPGHRSVAQGIRLPPIPPPEPVWTALLPVEPRMSAERKAAITQKRKVAKDHWQLWVRYLGPQGILSPTDVLLREACLIVAEMDACQYDIARRGRLIKDKLNPSVLELSKLRADLKPFIRDYGLSPLARDGLNPRESGGDDRDLFDS